MKKLKFILFLIPIIFLRNPYTISDSKILLAPSFRNILGTDNLGRDIYTRLLIGTCNTLLIVLISIVLASLLGILLGAISGYYSGTLDNIIQMFIEIILSIPSILIAISVIVIIGVGYKALILAIMLMYLPSITNYSRGLFIKEKDKEYIIAAKTYGVKSFRIITRHILPNIAKYIFLNFEINFSKAILTEAGLGFLGIGIDPSIPTLGNMLNSSQTYFLTAPWFPLFPGLTIIYIVYLVNNFSLKKGKKHGRIRN